MNENNHSNAKLKYCDKRNTKKERGSRGEIQIAAPCTVIAVQ